MPRFFPFLFLFLFSCSAAQPSPSGPSSAFLSSLQTTLAAIDQVAAVVSQFGGLFGDSRLSYALSDCLDLLDSSADALDRSSAAAQSPKGKHNSTGDLNSDLRTWVAAAVSNMDTCADGFDGTSGIAKQVVAGSLGQVTSLLSDLLADVGAGGMDYGEPEYGKFEFPAWVDAKVVEGNGAVADVTVAADGSGDFTTVMEAVEAAPEKSLNRFVIYVKSGVYRENVEIKKKKWNIMMVGDGMNSTVITGNRSFIDGWTTFRSATFAVSGRGFIARDITFENTAGPQKHQAVALRSDSDLAVFFRCAMRGFQDTLYTHTMRQFFRDCHISGTVDFIFGDATVVFQNCQIQARKGLPGQKNTVTAQGRKDPNQPTGFSLQFCNITAADDLLPAANSTATYLGRPWKLYSRTVVMQSYLSDAVRPEGWLEWNGDFALDTLVYGEYMNYGPGAGVGRRVKWPGFRVLNGSGEADRYTVGQFIEGNLWLPSTGVKYVSGLAV